MSALLICLAIFIWHLTWNMALNKVRGLKWVSLEQIIVSSLTSIIIKIIAGWSIYPAMILVLFVTIAYFINMIHFRYFGNIVAAFQVKQFLFVKGTAKTNGSMLFQAAGRLVRWSDIYYLITFSEVIIAFIVTNGEKASPSILWWTLNVVLAMVILITIRQMNRLSNGSMPIHTFGMFVSYYFTWIMDRRRSLEQAQIQEDFQKEYASNGIVNEDRLIEDSWFGKYKGMNVILIQLESFQQFLLHYKVEGQEVTPFMNRLARENIAFTDIFSQFSRGHTSDAELASLHSLYAMQNDVVNYKHYDKKFYGLPKILRKHGYESMAYHGYKGDFYNRRTMMNTHGFERFFSEEDYLLQDKASSWLSDFSFFEQSVEKIKKMKKPFFSFMISLTSHFPFKLEERLWGLKLSKDLPEFLSLYYQSVNYTDRALQFFYESLKQEGLMENTVFAFYGDHEGVSPEHLASLYDELGIQQSNMLKSTNRMRMAQVPFIIATDNDVAIESPDLNIVGSTLDVGPTLLHLLGLPKISYGMGTSLFTADKDRIIPLVQFPNGSFATTHTLLYASDSGEYVNSTIFDRDKETIVLPVSGENKKAYEFSKQQISRSAYLISNDKLVIEEKADDVETAIVVSAQFSTNIEQILSLVNDDSIVLPIPLALDQGHMNVAINDLSGISKLEEYYRVQRKKNIRFFSILDLDANDKPIYFEDKFYIDVLRKKGHKIELVNPITLPAYLQSLPDHVLVVAVAKDDAAHQFTESFLETMSKYGINKLNRTKYRHSYVNLIYKNKGFMSLYEKTSEHSIDHHWEKNSILNGVSLPVDVKLRSQGALSGNKAELFVNQVPCCSNERGLNFAVIDMRKGNVIEQFVADTFSTTYIDNGMYRAIKEIPIPGVIL